MLSVPLQNRLYRLLVPLIHCRNQTETEVIQFTECGARQQEPLYYLGGRVQRSRGGKDWKKNAELLLLAIA